MTLTEIVDLRAALEGPGRHSDPYEWSAEHMSPENYETAALAVAGARKLLATLDSRDVRIAELETRRDELLALTVRLANVVPFPDEVHGWTTQRAAMITEVGTLRARAAELSVEVDRLASAATASDRVASHYHTQALKLRDMYNTAIERVRLAVADIADRDCVINAMTGRAAHPATAATENIGSGLTMAGALCAAHAAGITEAKSPGAWYPGCNIEVGLYDTGIPWESDEEQSPGAWYPGCNIEMRPRTEAARRVNKFAAESTAKKMPAPRKAYVANITKSENSASIATWQNETFGPATTTRDRVQHSREAMTNAIGAAFYCDLSIPRPNLSRAVRAVEELAELISALVYDDSDPKACMEVAAVQIVLAGIPAWHGQEQGDLVDHKMALNRARHWNRTGDGHGQHVKEKP